MSPSNRHSLRRTSPKGHKFVGVCVLCGTEGLTLANMADECSNQRGLTADEAVLEAIEDKDMVDTVSVTPISNAGEPSR